MDLNGINGRDLERERREILDEARLRSEAERQSEEKAP
jgi:hypothetical protein